MGLKCRKFGISVESILEWIWSLKTKASVNLDSIAIGMQARFPLILVYLLFYDLKKKTCLKFNLMQIKSV